jgi:predicted NAD/FAD-binding protein
MRRVAVIGSGISGLVAAREISPVAQVTVFEAADHFGGHARTLDVSLEGHTGFVDTGFLVFNHRTYPGLTALFDELGVETAASDMSLSVQRPGTGFEWCGSNLDTVFAQRTNLLRPRFWGMLRDVLRFNQLASRWVEAREPIDPALSLRGFLRRHSLGVAFRDDYLLPMVASIWSCPTEQMLEFPIASLLHFCHNHGLLQISDRPQWRTVVGGSRRYVQRIVAKLHDVRLRTPVREVRRVPPGRGEAGVWVRCDRGSERFDEVVIACHCPQTLALLVDATAAERAILGAIRTQRNLALLHTDASLLPRRRKAWAAWNFEAGAIESELSVCLHYLINRLQPLPWSTPVIVSLNPLRPPRDDRILDVHEFEHPLFDAAAIDAQRRLATIQGRSGVWFCGAWAGHGFHEDGLQAGLAVGRRLRAALTASERTGVERVAA